jgi:hypothetical protein
VRQTRRHYWTIIVFNAEGIEIGNRRAERLTAWDSDACRTVILQFGPSSRRRVKPLATSWAFEPDHCS